MHAHTAANPLFGATETLSNTMRDAFRRMDMVEHRTRRAFKTTGDKTLKSALERSHASVATPQPPPAWRVAWLSNAPTVEELLLATHHAPSISPEDVGKHIEERQVQRQRREQRMQPTLTAHRTAPAPPVVVVQQRQPTNQPAPASQPQPQPPSQLQPHAPKPPVTAAASSSCQPSPRAAAAAAATTASSAAAAVSAATRAAPQPPTASTARPAPPPPASSTRPLSARGRLQSSGHGGATNRRSAVPSAYGGSGTCGVGGGGGSLSARARTAAVPSRSAVPSTTSALIGRKAVVSLLDSIGRREDLRSLLFDVKAAARDAAFQRTAEEAAAAKAVEAGVWPEAEADQTSGATQPLSGRPPQSCDAPPLAWEPGTTAAAVAAAREAAARPESGLPAAAAADAAPAPELDGRFRSQLATDGAPSAVAAVAATADAPAVRPTPPSHRAAPPLHPAAPAQPAQPRFQQRAVAPVHRAAPSHRPAPSHRAVGQAHAAATAPERIHSRVAVRTAVRPPRHADPRLVGVGAAAPLATHRPQPPATAPPPPSSQPPTPSSSPRPSALSGGRAAAAEAAAAKAAAKAAVAAGDAHFGAAKRALGSAYPYATDAASTASATAAAPVRIATPQRRSVTFAEEASAPCGFEMADAAGLRPASPGGLTFAAAQLDASAAVEQQQPQPLLQPPPQEQPGAIGRGAAGTSYHGGGRWADLSGAGEPQHVCTVPVSFVQGQRAPPPKPIASTEERASLALVRQQQGAS